jgi:2-hydroxy-4-carboxymuconate semialdehyde hemiacetal dehydrogenase
VHLTNQTPATLAIIGYGAIADYHALALAKLGANLVAVAGPNRDSAIAFAKRHAIPSVFEDLESAVQSTKFDGVVIASPSTVHADQAVAALKAGKSVLCEIPIGISLAQAEEVNQVALQSGLVAMVCHTQRFWPPVRALRTLLADRGLDPRHVVARSTMLRRENVGWTGRRRTWVDNLLWHHGCHVIDTTLLLIEQEIEFVSAVSGPLVPETGLPLDIAIAIKGGRGLGNISLSYNSTVTTNDYVVITDDEAFVIEDAKLVGQDGRILAGGDPEEMLQLAVTSQAAEFLRAIATGERPSTCVDCILPTMRVLQTIDDLCHAQESAIRREDIRP